MADVQTHCCIHFLDEYQPWWYYISGGKEASLVWGLPPPKHDSLPVQEPSFLWLVLAPAWACSWMENCFGGTCCGGCGGCGGLDGWKVLLPTTAAAKGIPAMIFDLLCLCGGCKARGGAWRFFTHYFLRLMRLPCRRDCYVVKGSSIWCRLSLLLGTYTARNSDACYVHQNFLACSLNITACVNTTCRRSLYPYLRLLTNWNCHSFIVTLMFRGIFL